MHAVGIALLRIGIVVVGWVLVGRIIVCALASAEEPLCTVSSGWKGVGRERTRWYASGGRPLLMRRFACQYPPIM